MIDHTPEKPTQEIPYGYCHCGCGQKTKIASRTSNQKGWIKGKPVRYIWGHNRGNLIVPDWESPNPSGICLCGCGQKTTIAPENVRSKGWIRGQPIRYLPGHNAAPYRPTLANAFWLYCEPGPAHECWLWTGPKTTLGYGYFKWQRKEYYAHRVAYELHYGPIPRRNNPQDASILHKCDNPSCQNWAHLLLGTQADNSLDMIAKGRNVIFRGKQNGAAKLSETDIVEIRQLREQGTSRLELAQQYNVSENNISRITNRKTWRHVP